ncbi:mitotic spindle checkpoint protein Mad1 [Schizosaccharomyces japonicus yFS275]|uniref:Spindle assembly checkpoint component MAD1 n=1 Tax=Schizosaccharomyces japonicus (strain yFS275 / FY16936) TaxID=402676 RepID=B6K808_SCHJY|nr:mitotic spindle checkpoint protein Mad1 [Schizosaccharomyces japonicus yFS275]EEB09662.1 mitotic spindle checkpoint protein Mad1 [Schizosaccharomyces japonicus yFS275]
MSDSPPNPFAPKSHLPRFFSSATSKPKPLSNVRPSPTTSVVKSLAGTKQFAREKSESLIKSLRHELDSCKSALKEAELANEIKSSQMEARLQEQCSSEKLLREQIELLKKENSEVLTRLKVSEKQFADEKVLLQQKEASLQQELQQEKAQSSITITQLTQNVAAMEKKVISSEEQYTLLEKQLKLTNERKEELQTKYQVVVEECDKLRDTVTSLEEACNLQSVKAQDTESIKALQIQNEQLQTKLNSLEKLVDRQSATLSSNALEKHNFKLLEEEKKSLLTKLSVLDGFRDKVATLELKNNELEGKLRPYLELLGETKREPHDILHELSALEMENKSLREESNRLTETVAKLKTELAGANSVPELEEEITSLNETQRELAMQLRRLTLQKDLALREVHLLRENLKSYSEEESVLSPETYDKKKTERIDSLTKLIDDYKSTLENVSIKPEVMDVPVKRKRESLGLSRSNFSDSLKDKMKELFENLERTRFELKEKGEVEQFLRTEIANFERNMAELRQQNLKISELLNARVLQQRDNPTLCHERVKQSTLELLQKENANLRTMLTQGECDTVPLESLTLSEQRCKQLEIELKSREKRMQRLKEVFALKSSEIREAVYSLLGYKLEFMSNGCVRVTSMYAKEGDNSFQFDGESSTMQILGSSKSPEIQNLVKFWCEERKTIPGLLSALTLELIERNENTRS